MISQPDLERARFNMIEQQIRTWEVLDQEVLSLLSVVKREDFVPPAYRSMAFVDTEVPLPNGQAMLAPKVEARLLQELGVQRHERVLEIGAGSGYAAAVIGRIAKSVIAIERHAELAELAAARMERLARGALHQLLPPGSEIWLDGGHNPAAGEVLARIGLADRAGSKVRDLSGGQMRRLEIARALLHRPRLLLLDEATVGLDVKARAEIISHVRQLVAEQGIGVLWATHLLDEIVPSDDLVVLHQGRVLAHGPVARIIADTATQDINASFKRLTETAAESESLSP